MGPFLRLSLCPFPSSASREHTSSGPPPHLPMLTRVLTPRRGCEMRGFCSQRALAPNAGPAPACPGPGSLHPCSQLTSLVNAADAQHRPPVVVGKGWSQQRDVNAWPGARGAANALAVDDYYYWLRGRKKHCANSRPASRAAVLSAAAQPPLGAGPSRPRASKAAPRLRIDSRC